MEEHHRWNANPFSGLVVYSVTSATLKESVCVLVCVCLCINGGTLLSSSSCSLCTGVKKTVIVRLWGGGVGGGGGGGGCSLLKSCVCDFI